ncbi:MAG TPA: AAA family ATPase, partial [Polyangium sp.]|nr:AAA family ATPase [Polyangium sp.]
MKIPYATCDFAAIRREGYFYVDKTPFIRRLEAADEKHVIFLRPRRFGKSTLISTLQNYYDILFADKFDERFGGLWIHQNPTPNRNKYLVLTLDFSPVDTYGDEAKICTSFAWQVKIDVRSFIMRYQKLIPALSDLLDFVKSDSEDMATLMSSLLQYIGNAGHQMYLLIDEYDHFGNRLLSDGRDDVYKGLIRSAGFVRSFYASLKRFTRESTIARTFVTGVSPIMLDDLSSGFNIITHISNWPLFNGMAGFTRADVERAVDTLLADKPHLGQDPRIGDRDVLLATLERHYNGYRFSPKATEKMYNSTLVLYFLAQLKSDDTYPRNMLDLNVRTDYGRLYGLVTAATAQPLGTRELLDEILTNESIEVPLVEQFGTVLPMGRAQIASLFYYMGMLTFGPDSGSEQVSQLVIPNRVMRELQWSYLSIALAQHDNLRIDMTDIEQSLNTMAKTGEIQPLLDVFKKQVLERVSNKDLRKFDEKNMKLMLMAYICQTQVFSVASELELMQGYCDLLLGIRSQGSSAKYAWIIEAKYVKTNATPHAIGKA